MISKTALAILFPILGALVLLWGMPRANRHLLPWRWRVGTLMIGGGLIFWPLFYFFAFREMQMYYVPIFLATFMTFLIGVRRLLWADRWEPSHGGTKGNWGNDFGWVLRPRPKPRSGNEVFEQAMEDRMNPFAAGLRRTLELGKSSREGTSPVPPWLLILLGLFILSFPILFLWFTGIFDHLGR